MCQNSGVDWRVLEEERHRPIPTAERYGWWVGWHQSPGRQYQRKPLTSLEGEELAELGYRVLAELARKDEGAVTVARLLARWGPRREKAS